MAKQDRFGVSNFSRDIERFSSDWREEADAIFKDATQRVSNSIVRLSPVAEGEYVADWDVKIGGYPSDTDQPPDPKKRKTRARLREALEAVKFGDVIFFENSDPVSTKLEFGYSDQAPQGVVRLTARNWNKFVRGAASAQRRRNLKRLRGE